MKNVPRSSTTHESLRPIPKQILAFSFPGNLGFSDACLGQSIWLEAGDSYCRGKEQKQFRLETRIVSF